MARIKKNKQAYKKHLKNIINNEKEADRLLRELRKEVSQTNQQLKSLQRHYKSGTWSTKKLSTRLDSTTLMAWDNRTGKVKIPKNLTNTQINAMLKAMKQFQDSATSTRRGINKVSNKTKQAMKESLSIDKEISDEDVNTLYDMLNDKDFRSLSDDIGASSLWQLLEDSKELNKSEDSFVNMLTNHMNSNDIDIKTKASNLYKKYIK